MLKRESFVALILGMLMFLGIFTYLIQGIIVIMNNFELEFRDFC